MRISVEDQIDNLRGFGIIPGNKSGLKEVFEDFSREEIEEEPYICLISSMASLNICQTLSTFSMGAIEPQIQSYADIFVKLDAMTGKVLGLNNVKDNLEAIYFKRESGDEERAAWVQCSCKGEKLHFDFLYDFEFLDFNLFVRFNELLTKHGVDLQLYNIPCDGGDIFVVFSKKQFDEFKETVLTNFKTFELVEIESDEDAEVGDFDLFEDDSYSGPYHIDGNQYLFTKKGFDVFDLLSIKEKQSLNGLHFTENQNISDLSPLSEFEEIEELRIINNPLKDLSPIAEFQNLEGLLLKSTQIEDLSHLKNLTKLVCLELEDNQIVDLSPLSNLKNLRFLILNNNRIVDLSPLKDLIKLQTIELNDNRVSDLSPLASLMNLEVLYLGNNQITDLSPLKGLPKLDELILKDNQVTDISPLNHPPQELWILNLDGNPVDGKSRKEKNQSV